MTSPSRQSLKFQKAELSSLGSSLFRVHYPGQQLSVMRHFLLKIVPRKSLGFVELELCLLFHAKHSVLSRDKVLQGVSQFLPRVINLVTSLCSRKGGSSHCSSGSAHACSLGVYRQKTLSIS